VETDVNEDLREWNSLSAREQLELRIDYGHYLDSLPPTCTLGLKLEYFRAWLRTQGVRYGIVETGAKA
jgi:hypothetical protein